MSKRFWRIGLALCLGLLLSFLAVPRAQAKSVFEDAREGFPRIYHIDCGRKYFSPGDIMDLIDAAAENGFTHLELGFGNKGLRFLLDDMSVTTEYGSYESEAVKAGIRAGNIAFYDSVSGDGALSNELSQSDMDRIIAYAETKNIGIIPLLNSPGHMNGILKAMEQAGIANAAFVNPAGGTVSSSTVDLTNGEAVAFTQALVRKYIAYFAGKGCAYFNMGADEYASDAGTYGFQGLIDNGRYGLFAAYVNALAADIKSAGMTPMAFHDGFYYSGVEEYAFDTDILLCCWHTGWGQYQYQTPEYLAEKGFRLINTNAKWYFVLGNPYKDKEKEFFTYWTALDSARSVDYTTYYGGESLPEATEGVMLCLWCDVPSKQYVELTRGRIREIMAAFADSNEAVFGKRQTVTLHEDFYKVLHIDCGRKYFSEADLKRILDVAALNDYTHVQLALGNDGIRLLLEDMSVATEYGSYDSEAVTAALQAGNLYYQTKKNTAPDMLTQAEMDRVLAYAQEKGMGIIPLINSPGHMDAIGYAMNELGIDEATQAGSWHSVNMANNEALAFVTELLQKYMDYFAARGCRLYNMGCDEYAMDKESGALGFQYLINQGLYGRYIQYVNELSARVKRAGMLPLAFNDGFYYGGHTASGTFDTDILVCYWNSSWGNYNVATPSALLNRGLTLLNCNRNWYYNLGILSTDKYAHYQKALRNTGEVAYDEVILLGKANTQGCMVCLWCDIPSNPLDEAEHERIALWARSFAMKNPEVFEPGIPPVDFEPGEEWTLLPGASDEFEGESLDTEKWYDTRWYSASWKNIIPRADQVSVRDGCLVLTAKKEAYQGKSYVVGSVYSKFDVPGVDSYVEVRARVMDSAARLLSAIWMQNPKTQRLNPNPEIDILETVNFAQMESVIHEWPVDANGKTWRQDEEYRVYKYDTWVEDISQDFHTYGLMRSGNILRFYFDGRLTWEKVADSSAYGLMGRNMLFSLEDHTLGEISDENLEGAEFQIDYVRSYYRNARENVPESGKMYRIINQNSSLALSLPADSSGEGVQLIQTADAERNAAEWILTQNTDLSYTVKNARTGALLSLSASGRAAEQGLAVVARGEEPGASDQRWMILEDAGGFYIQSLCSGLVLNVSGSSAADGAPVIQWPDSGAQGAGNDRWQLEEYEGEIFTGAEALKLNYDSLSLAVGESFALGAYPLPADAQTVSVAWSSSEPGVAAVDENGCITAIAAGEAVITATAGEGLSDSCRVTVSAPAAVQSTMEDNAFIRDWKFYYGDIGGGEALGLNDSGWRTLQLPHDYSSELNYTRNGTELESGYLPGGTAWYRKHFVLPEEAAGSVVRVHFGGVYMNATVYINGQCLGVHRYGYTPFSFDLSDYVICDGRTENMLAVKVEHTLFSSRWYSGSGILRPVNLTVEKGPVIQPYGVAIRTPDLASEAGGSITHQISTEVCNPRQEDQTITLVQTLYDGGFQREIASVQDQFTLEAGETKKLPQTLHASGLALWSVDSPVLYQLRTDVVLGGRVVSSCWTQTGYRWVRFDTETGFYLNGEPMKLKGVCLHSDQGSLGTAVNEAALRRQVGIMKDMGVNAIRVAHNPASEELLHICDEMGMMLLEEAFDTWSMSKNGNSQDYGKWFAAAIASDNQILGGKDCTTWAEFDIKAMVRRSRNAPSIIMYSLGNEIYESTGSNSNSAYPGHAGNLIRWLREEAPDHVITIGDNRNNYAGAWHSQHVQIDDMITAAGGAVGLNYARSGAVYDEMHANHPEWALYASETSSAFSSRDFYLTRGKNESLYQVAAYGGTTPSWGETAWNAWQWVIERDFVAGEFIWTGIDYIGEPTPWNQDTGKNYPKSSYFGAVDTAGIPKDLFYFYRSQWNETDTTLHISPYWNTELLAKESNGSVEMRIYSNADAVELFLNGRSLGKKTLTEYTTSLGYTYRKAENGNLYLTWYVPFEAGVLWAVAYDAAGNVIENTSGRSVVATAGETARIRLSAYEGAITADGESVAFILAEALDDKGNVVPGAADLIDFSVSGEGVLLATDNGDPTDTTQMKSAARKLFYGKAVAMVRSTDQAGGFTLTARAEGLEPVSLRVDTVDEVRVERPVLEESVAVIQAASMTVAQQIDANIMVLVPEEAVKAVATYSYTDPTATVPARQEFTFADMEKDSQGRYRLVIANIPAKEMTEVISLTILDKDGNELALTQQTKAGSLAGGTFNFRVVDYVNNVLLTHSDVKYQNIGKAMLNYGQMAQLQFGHKLEDLANPEGFLEAEMAAVTANAAYDIIFPEGNSEEKTKTALGYKSMALNLEGVTEVYLYFDHQVTAVDASGKAYKVEASGNRFRVVIENIFSNKLHEMHTVIVKEGGKDYTFKVSALSYANRMLNNASMPESLKNVCRALYLYNEAAREAFR